MLILLLKISFPRFYCPASNFIGLVGATFFLFFLTLDLSSGHDVIILVMVLIKIASYSP